MRLQPNSGSGDLSYYSPSGCSSSSPCAGDLSGIRLTLSLRPIGTTYVHIPQLGEYRTPDGGSPYCRSVNRIILAQGLQVENYWWEVPSHPAAGGGPQAGEFRPPDFTAVFGREDGAVCINASIFLRQ